MAATLAAMSRIQEIKARREAAFFKARMQRSGNTKKAQKEKDRMEVHRNAHVRDQLRKKKDLQPELERIRVKAKKAKSALQAGEGTKM